MATDRSFGACSTITVPPPCPLPCADRSAAPNSTAPTTTTGFARITLLLRGLSPPPKRRRLAILFTYTRWGTAGAGLLRPRRTLQRLIDHQRKLVADVGG